MMRVTVLILWVLCSLTAFAQSKSDSLRIRKKNAVIGAIGHEIIHADSASKKVGTYVPSNGSFIADSVKTNLVRYHQRVDSIKLKLTKRIDSLKGKQLPYNNYSHFLDSLQHSGPVKNLKEAETKLNQLQARTNKPLDKADQGISNLTGKINAPLNDLKKEGMDVPNLNLPTGANPLRKEGMKNSMPLIKSDSPLNINDPLKKDIPNGPLGPSSIQGTALDDLQKETSQVGQVNQQANGYLKEAKDVSKGDLSQTKNLSQKAEAVKLDGVKDLQKETKVLDDYKGKLEVAGNPEQLKKQVSQDAKKEAINHFAGREEALKQAITQMEKYKLKFPDATTVDDLTKRVRNEMYGKPFLERIVPAFSLQFLNKGDFLVDVNPQLGYRLSGKWTAGAGWVERIQFHTITNVVPQGRIFGPRAFTDIKWKKGISLRADVEYINLYVTPGGTVQTEDDSRTWKWGFYAGIKKSYRIAKGVNGNLQVMYKIDHQLPTENPYQDRINIRLGMEFPLKKSRIEKDK